MFEKFEDFKYIGSTLNMKNNWVCEFSIHLHKFKKTNFVLTKYFDPKNSKKN